METVKLSNGVIMPMEGFGVFQIPEEACEQAVKDTEEKILCRTPFSKRSHIGNLRQIRKQGKGRSSKRKGNRRCPFLFAHRRGYGVAPAVRRRRIPR